MPIFSVIARPGMAAALLLLAAACAPLPRHPEPGPGALAVAALQALPDAPLSALQRQQWLDRVTWGADEAGDAGLERLGLKAWLARQLQPDAALPAPLAQQLAALPSSRSSMADTVAGLEALRQAARQAGSDAEQVQRRQEYQRALNQLAADAQQSLVLRALHAPAQLREQMTWFWLNHFSVSVRKADLRAWVGDYTDQAIRPHALGNFRQLLGATLRHPAMLRYLDNASNAAGRINENYARELLELHTMGVEGGYTQADVQELARVLTGVGVNLGPPASAPPRLAPQLRADYVRQGFFEFNPARHDYGPKTLLGQPLHARGMAEVDEALDRIAAAPATARFIARKLAVFFIADEPPPALVQRTAQAFERSHGDIAATLAALLAAPEAAHFGAKFRDPVHYVFAATRLALDGRMAADAAPVAGWLAQLGQGLYAHETPNGYPAQRPDWDGPGQLAARFEVARQIGTRSAVLLRSSAQQPLPQPPHAPLAQSPLAQQRLAGWSPASRAALARAPSAAEWNILFLCAPEMMYR